MKLSLILSPLAESDFTDIIQYTLETWGNAQALAYGVVLDKALTLIRKNPQIGRNRPELSAEYRIFPAGQHIIVYRVTAEAISVSRILHVSLEIKGTPMKLCVCVVNK